jgi:hypothetical protein
VVSVDFDLMLGRAHTRGTELRRRRHRNAQTAASIDRTALSRRPSLLDALPTPELSFCR